MKNKIIKKYQGSNKSWFISLNNEIICGCKNEKYIDEFIKVVKKMENII